MTPMDKPKYTAAELFAAQALASHAKKELTENILHIGYKKPAKATPDSTEESAEKKSLTRRPRWEQ